MDFAYLIEPPFNFKDASGTVTGCDVELARIILTRLGMAPIRFHETEFAELLPGLASGKWRMTTGQFATEPRKELALFSRPIWALPDGLLVRAMAGGSIFGYRTFATPGTGLLAVVRDQVQHATALDLGVPPDRITIFETYVDAARAVAAGTVTAFASVARAHAGYLGQAPDRSLAVVAVPAIEREPAFGCYALARSDGELRSAVDAELAAFLGKTEHRTMMSRFGFADADIDLVAGRSS